MGRKPNALTPLAEVPVLDDEALQASSSALTALAVQATAHEAAVRQLATRIGYDLPAGCIDPDLIQRDIAVNMRRSVEACLEVGRGLAVLKEACEHGQFMTRIDALGIEVRIAQRFIQSAAKFSNASSTPLLKAAGNQTKLFEMLVLDDEQVEELEQTGQTGGLALDDVASMSVKELREALRKERDSRKAEKNKLDANHKADMQAKDRLMANVRERANEAEERLAKLETQGIPLDKRFSELSADVLNLGKRADDALVEVANLYRAIEQVLTDAFDPESLQPLDRDGAIALAQRVRDQGFRLARTVGRIQAVVDDSIYPLISMEEMHLPYILEDGRPIEG